MSDLKRILKLPIYSLVENDEFPFLKYRDIISGNRFEKLPKEFILILGGTIELPKKEWIKVCLLEEVIEMVILDFSYTNVVRENCCLRIKYDDFGIEDKSALVEIVNNMGGIKQKHLDYVMQTTYYVLSVLNDFLIYLKKKMVNPLVLIDSFGKSYTNISVKSIPVFYFEDAFLEDKIIFSFAEKLALVNRDELDKILVTKKAMIAISKKVLDYDNKKQMYPPFKLCLVNFDERFTIICQHEVDDMQLETLIFARNRKIIAASLDLGEIPEGEKREFMMRVYPGYFKCRDLRDQDYMELTNLLTSMLSLLFYFIANYSIKEKKESAKKLQKKERKEKANITSVPKEYISESKVVLPRIKVCYDYSDPNVIRESKKRRNPVYYLSSWKRRGHYRNYRKKDGTIHQVWIEDKTVTRKLPNLGFTNQKTYIIDEAKVNKE